MATKKNKNIRGGLNTAEALRKSEFNEAIKKIAQKDPAMLRAIQELVIHAYKADYTNKYGAEASPIQTKGLIYHNSPLAKGYNVGQATRYIQRYMSGGFDKSNNPTDLKKGTHFMLFELSRLIRHEDMDKRSKDIIE